jgi:phosphomannomutase
MALALADKINADIVIGTDPDCDRLGIAEIMKGQMTLLNGNQTMILMTAFIRKWKNAGKNKTNLLDQRLFPSDDDGTSDNYDVECKVGLTGFKWIAKMIKFPEQEFIGGGEESFDIW